MTIIISKGLKSQERMRMTMILSFLKSLLKNLLKSRKQESSARSEVKQHCMKAMNDRSLEVSHPRFGDHRCCCERETIWVINQL